MRAPLEPLRLSYGRAQPIFRVGLMLRILLLAVAVSGLFIAGYWAYLKIGPEIGTRIKVNRLQKLVATDTVDPSVVMYDQPVLVWRMRDFRRRGFLWGPSTAPAAPEPPLPFESYYTFRRLVSIDHTEPGYLLYAHGISNSGGEHLLIRVAISLAELPEKPRLIVEVLRPGGFLRYPSRYDVTYHPFEFPSSITELDDAGLKIYAGQPDPHDPSRFTIDYNLSGQRHTVDGHLSDSDAFTIEEQGTPTTQPLPLSSGQSR